MRILKNIKVSNHEARIFVIQFGGGVSQLNSYMDLSMIYFLNGKLRSIDQMKMIAHDTGMNIKSIQNTRSPFEIFELE